MFVDGDGVLRNTIDGVLVDLVFLQAAGVIWAFSVVSRMRSILEGQRTNFAGLDRKRRRSLRLIEMLLESAKSLQGEL